MLVTNHVLSGALLGALTRNPLLAFPVGFASHLALDAAPHWGKWESHRKFVKIAVADGMTGLTVMAVATAVADPRQRTAVLAGMVGAALPDLNKPARMFFGRSPFPAGFDALHARIQDEAPHRFRSHEVLGGAVFGTAFVALAFGARRKSAAARGA